MGIKLYEIVRTCILHSKLVRDLAVFLGKKVLEENWIAFKLIYFKFEIMEIIKETVAEWGGGSSTDKMRWSG